AHRRAQDLLIDGLQYQSNRLADAAPFGSLDLEALRPGASQRIELRLASAIGDAPLRPKPSTLFEPVQRGIQRPLIDLKRRFRHLIEPLRDCVTVERTKRHDLQD